jgi:ankyrin repeat protein
MQEAVEAGASLLDLSPDGKSLLELAQRAGAVHAARFMLDRGVDPNVKTNTHETLLHRAARQGDLGFVALLLEYGANPEAVDGKKRRPVDVVVPKGGYVHSLLASRSKQHQPLLF